MATFDITLRTRASLHPDGEPSDFVTEYTGVLTCTDDESGERAPVGKVRAMRVQAALAANAGESLFAVCDAHSHELHHLQVLLYAPESYDFREVITRRFDTIHSDLLILDYIVLDPKWRKLKIGLLAAKKMVDLLGGGCGLAVSLIAPLRASCHKLLGVEAAWLPRFESKDERGDGIVGLRRYFRRMGFRRLGRTPYYALALSHNMPDGSELLGPD
jgi:hypothetical protein